MSEPLLSVIIPAHNAESVLGEALGSVCAQKTSFPFEVLVSDDGSSDGTAALAGNWPDKRVRVIKSAENGGVSAARNRALDAARGRYVAFLDSDDLLIPFALESAVRALTEQKAELVVFGFALENVDEHSMFDYVAAERVLDSVTDYRDAVLELYARNMLNPCWNKVCSLDLIRRNGIRFPAVPFGEDRLFCFDLIAAAPRAVVLPYPLYRYRRSARETLSTRYLPEKFEICLSIDRRIEELCRAFGVPEIERRPLLNYMLVKSALSCLTPLDSPACPLSRAEKRAAVGRVIRDPALVRCRTFPRGCGRAFRLSARVLATKNVTLTRWMTRCIRLSARLFPDGFRRAKHAYNA